MLSCLSRDLQALAMDLTKIHLHKYNLRMVNHPIPSLRSDQERELLVQTDSSLVLGGSTLPKESISVLYEAEKCSLSEGEVGKLERWIKQWKTPNSRCRLYIGGADKSSRSNRLRRLGFLLSLLEQLGVPQRRVQADSDWLKPTRMGAIDDLPADAIWLQIRGFHAGYSLPAERCKPQHQ